MICYTVIYRRTRVNCASKRFAPGSAAEHVQPPDYAEQTPSVAERDVNRRLYMEYILFGWNNGWPEIALARERLGRGENDVALKLTSGLILPIAVAEKTRDAPCNSKDYSNAKKTAPFYFCNSFVRTSVITIAHIYVNKFSIIHLFHLLHMIRHEKPA